RELRVPRGEERAGAARGANQSAPPPAPARDDRRRGGRRRERRRHRRFESRARARRRRAARGRDHGRRRGVARFAGRSGADGQGARFVGQAGKLLERLLGGIGLWRDDVYIANVLKCRPPGNRDPQPDEIESCEPHLFRQIELIEPKVIATLGNFATKLLSGRPLGITRVHGQEQALTIAGRSVLLYPLYHPAAALYTPAMLKVLEADFARLPELMGRGLEPAAVAAPDPEPAIEAPAEQLGLF